MIRYELSEQQLNRLESWHYHGNVEDAERFKILNDKTKELAELIMLLTPVCRNQSIALTDLESVRMRANAAIAVDEGILRGKDYS